MPRSKQKRAAWEIRNELQEEIGDALRFDPAEVTSLAKEAEVLYNSAASVGKPPSELFERLILFLQCEARTLNHPDRDMDYECAICGRK